ncbi:MAG: DUF4783 domain-containing protein [Bacteroidia bacterium]|nr:DUF4783 domain-containing protein [Bacteroidia bacterium]
MKVVNNIALLLCITVLTLSQAYAQGPADILDQVSTGLMKGDVSMLSGHFGERVEITLMGSRQVHSHTQADYVMGKFFADYPPTSFYFQHNGETGGTTYAIGEYRSAKGTFEVNVFIRIDGGQRKITEIRFE